MTYALVLTAETNTLDEMQMLQAKLKNVLEDYNGCIIISSNKQILNIGVINNDE